ncbi:MAG TPA: F0F1 ATP synthase subunit B [Candidatus Saccharimonadales bacterium]|nr:F0F1 ATP synthase subunit B [Candidatus Saccharimonadales bacterium]
MILTFVAEASSSGSPLAALGVSLKTFVIQLITFVLVFLVLKRFAFKPITKLLEERRKVIDDGVKAGQKLAADQAEFEKKMADATRDARHEADKIIANGHKEAREIIREAEKVAGRKAEGIISDAEVRIAEEAAHSRRKLEKEIVGLISEATEAIVGEKIDSKKDAALIDRVMKGLNKKS